MPAPDWLLFAGQCFGHVQCVVFDAAVWEKLIEIGVKVVLHARYVIFQMGEVAVTRKGVP